MFIFNDLSKIGTAIFLVLISGLVFYLYRGNDKTQANKRCYFLLAIAYSIAISTIFISKYHGQRIALYLLMFSFVPVLFYIEYSSKRLAYKGKHILILTALTATAIGIVIQYHIGQNLTKFGVRIPVAVVQLIFSSLGLLLVLISLFAGRLEKIVTLFTERSSTFFWGACSFILLALPSFSGSAIAGTKSWMFGGSGQPSEFVLKITFPLFLAKFLDKKSEAFNSTDVMANFKTTAWLAGLAFVFFFFPLVFIQRENGTALVMALTFLAMVTLVSGRLYYFILGALLIALSMAVAALTVQMSFFIHIDPPVFHHH